MWMAPTHKMSVTVDQWCKEVEKRTNGRVKVTPYFGGTLAAPQLVYDGLLKGAFDIGQTALAYNTGRFPFSEILDYPLGYRDAIQATALDNAFMAKFKPQLKIRGREDALFLHSWELLSSTPVRSLTA